MVASPTSGDSSPARRDDRTVRTLAQLLGDSTRASVAFTHFTAARVLLSATADTLISPNGWLAFATVANMLTRFIGALDLDVVPSTPGALPQELVDRVAALIIDLRSIDTRPEKHVDRAAPADSSENLFSRDAYVVHLHVGAGSAVSSRGAYMLGITCGAWDCSLLAEAPAGPVVSSDVPFGALTAACFGAAEVFKAALAESVNSDMRERFSRRLVRQFCYSTWTAGWTQRIDTMRRHAMASPPDQVDLSGIVQVGAGAVGNASALALSKWDSAVGTPTLLDSKVVDERNLNRCLTFRERDVGSLKVRVVEARTNRPGFTWRAIPEPFDAGRHGDAWLLLSTVDNNEVRHQMQEAVPAWLVQGSTNGTQVAVSVHSAVDGRSCLVCRHPDPATGTMRRRGLTIREAAERLGLAEEVIQYGRFEGRMAVTQEFLRTVRAVDSTLADFFAEEATLGHDLCGALGRFRDQFGVMTGPEEPSVPFASAFAGVQAAAEVAKLALVRSGVECVPILDNVLQLDMAMDYTRDPSPSFREPQRGDCEVCRQRGMQVQAIYRRRHGQVRRDS